MLLCPHCSAYPEHCSPLRAPLRSKSFLCCCLRTFLAQAASSLLSTSLRICTRNSSLTTSPDEPPRAPTNLYELPRADTNPNTPQRISATSTNFHEPLHELPQTSSNLKASKPQSTSTNLHEPQRTDPHKPPRTSANLHALPRSSAAFHKLTRSSTSPHEHVRIPPNLDERTNPHKPLQASTSLHEPPRASTSLHEPPRTSACLHEPLRTSTDRHEPQHTSTSCHNFDELP